MAQQNGRYSASAAARAAEGWTLERLTPLSRLFNANGLRTGADGRIYVAQGIGSQVGAIDVQSGAIEVTVPKGSAIACPDDLAFDAQGNLYVTEVMDGRVSVIDPHGRTRVLRDDLPNANGITFHQDRLFIDECRHGGRLLELDLDGGAPRVLLENLPMPNALAPGPDGWLYFPVLEANEIWRVHPDTAKAERVAADLGVPDAVKFDAKGRIVSTQVGTGEVLRIDPQSGERTVLARLDPGLDNLTFVGERLFVSHLTDGRVTEILADGRTRLLVPPGLNWPLGLSVAENGTLFIADGFSFYALPSNGKLTRVSNVFEQSAPAGIRGVAALGDGSLIVTTYAGIVARYYPHETRYEVLAEGLDELYGVALAPDGSVIVAERGTGRLLSIRSGEIAVLASGLRDPKGVAVDTEGTCFVSEAGAGRVSRLVAGQADTVLDGLHEPQGIAVHGGVLYVIDVQSKALIAFDLKQRQRRTIGSELPVGNPAGVVPQPLRGVPWFCGPLGSFAGVAVDSKGVVYVSGDAEGSVLALRPQ